MIKYYLIYATYLVALNCQVPLNELYPFGSLTGDSLLPDADDGFSPAITIPNMFPFFRRNHTRLFVNTNGIIVFNVLNNTHTPKPFPITDFTGIAPFWADIDTRSGGGKIFYRNTTNNVQLATIAEEIKKGDPRFFNLALTWGFIATWVDVCQYEMRCRFNNESRNTFQAVLATNGKYSFAIFKYSKLNWGNALIGFNEGDGINSYSDSNSFTPFISNVQTTSNVRNPGVWIFRVDLAAIDELGGCNPSAPAIATPSAGYYIGNYDVKITGPCFLGNNEVSIWFSTGFRGICRVLTSVEASCPVPMINRPGRIDFEVNIGNNQRHFGFFQSVVENNIMSTGILVNNDLFVDSTDTVIITWNVTGNSILTLMTAGVTLTGNIPLNWKRIVSTNNPLSFTTSFQMNKVLNSTTFSQNFFFYLIDSNGNIISSSKILFFFGSFDINVATCREWHNKPEDITVMRNQLATTFPCPRFLTIPAGGLSNVQIPNFVVDQNCLPGDICPFNPGAGVCFRSIRASASGHGQQCCYSKAGTLLIGAPSGGSIDKFYASTISTLWNHMIEDILPYIKCCRMTNECSLYYQKRPSDTGQFWNPPQIGGGSGDPHFVTLDNASYTFNGFGEYTFLKVDSIGFEAQVRLSPLKNSSMNNKATVISAIACKERNSPIIQIELTNSGSISVIFNGTWLSFDLVNTWNMDEFVISKVNSTYSIKYISGIAMEVQINNERNQLSLLTFIVQDFKGKTQGLLGLWDDDITNDFLLPNGTFLMNLTEMQVHYEFGQMWEVTQNTSLFTYSTGYDFNDYRNPNFRPLFINENLIFANPQLEQAAKLRCGENKECLFDIAISGDINFSDLHLQIKETVEDQKEVFEVETLITQQNLNESLSLTTELLMNLTQETSTLPETTNSNIGATLTNIITATIHPTKTTIELSLPYTTMTVEASTDKTTISSENSSVQHTQFTLTSERTSTKISLPYTTMTVEASTDKTVIITETFTTSTKVEPISTDKATTIVEQIEGSTTSKDKPLVTVTMPSIIPVTSTETTGLSQKNLWIIVGSSVGFVVLIIFIVLFCCCCHRPKKIQDVEDNSVETSF